MEKTRFYVFYFAEIELGRKQQYILKFFVLIGRHAIEQSILVVFLLQ